MKEEEGERYTLTAPANAGAARMAREFMTAALVATDHRRLIENARICVSDTVANIVRHARVRELTVELTAHPGRVRVSVRDDDPHRLPWRGGGGSPGLALVRRLSHASGVWWVWDDLELVGKQVWFEFRCGRPAARAEAGAVG
ncbi:ATP-binding protein [Streptomyces sp. NPDC049585]|uniref:ATP-binding protein n=1 Tax=Streptomyces sp. NPDC049585 TaxID=3155154 RepID=UPI003448FBB7